jgi:hypothetical protein
MNTEETSFDKLVRFARIALDHHPELGDDVSVDALAEDAKSTLGLEALTEWERRQPHDVQQAIRRAAEHVHESGRPT